MEKLNRPSPKILVLVCSAGMPPWEQIEDKGQRATFAKNDLQDVQFIWYQGSLRKTNLILSLCSKLFEISFNGLWKRQNHLFMNIVYKIIFNHVFQKLINVIYRKTIFFDSLVKNSKLAKRILKIPIPRNYGFMGTRVQVANFFAASLPNWDLVLRTNSSSYFDVEQLLEVAKNLPLTRVYAGVEVSSHGVRFRSGAGNILSRDVLEKVNLYSGEWNQFLPEDLALGKIIQDHNLADAQKLPRADLENVDSAAEYLEGPLKRVWHYRCKAMVPETSIKIMKYLYKNL